MKPRIKAGLYQQDSVDIFRPFTDLMSNAFMIISFFLILLLFQALIQSEKLEDANRKLNAAQPIIIDEQSANFKFQSGSAAIPKAFQAYLETQIIPKILNAVQTQDIEFIQVIGHTDGQPNNQFSNLDQNLEKAAFNQTSVTTLQPGSNADLGLIRAIAVIQTLQKTGKLNHVSFQAYSAAQLYLPSGKLAPSNRQSDEARRRIEIRFVPPGRRN